MEAEIKGKYYEEISGNTGICLEAPASRIFNVEEAILTKKVRKILH